MKPLGTLGGPKGQSSVDNSTDLWSAEPLLPCVWMSRGHRHLAQHQAVELLKLCRTHVTKGKARSPFSLGLSLINTGTTDLTCSPHCSQPFLCFHKACLLLLQAQLSRKSTSLPSFPRNAIFVRNHLPMLAIHTLTCDRFF